MQEARIELLQRMPIFGGIRADTLQCGGPRSLAASCPCQSRHRRGRADHARLANAEACGPENDKHLRTRQAERQLEPLS